jgi:alkyl hydroperoxide reductase subunit AhpC
MSYAKIGTPAPHFSLPAFDPREPNNNERTVSLADFKGKWLVFYFYPMDFTFVCPTEILALADRKAEFDEIGCEIVGCSTDTYFTHKAWVQTPRAKNGIEGTNYLLAADHSGEIARAYGVLIEGKNIAHRGLFVIDPQGVLQYSVVTALNVGRSVDETLRIVQALQTDQC